MSLLELRDVSKNFGSYKAMDDVSFQVEPGRIVGLIGPNGAGKSTTMRAITGLMSYSAGEVRFDGKKVSLSHHSSLNEMGNLIEYPSIYPNFTARDHMKYFAMDVDNPADIDEIMHMTEIDGEKFGKRKAKHFSLGMKQRLGIAIALVRNPKLVVLDEPMNGLDPQSVRDIRALISNLAEKKGVSFLISSHLLDELQRLADDVVIVNKGRIIRKSTMADFLAEDKAQIQVTTNDHQKMLDLAKENGWTAHEFNNRVAITVDGDVTAQLVLQKATTAGLTIDDIQTTQTNLEDHLLEVLQSDNQ
ncbi:ATP-binding cassette domain-containing protein [Leuconostocaceae bacterium ESL0958]|nr:ATP-binding cassette domain-containing protein [Leuconostocaceae bacterium ESL0958]